MSVLQVLLILMILLTCLTVIYAICAFAIRHIHLRAYDNYQKIQLCRTEQCGLAPQLNERRRRLDRDRFAIDEYAFISLLKS